MATKKATSKKTSAKKATAARPSVGAAAGTGTGAATKPVPGRRSRLADVQVEVPNVGRVTVLQTKAANVVQQLGGPSSVARMLQVARSQPGRWVKGTEAPSARSAKHLLDLDYVLSRLEQLYDPETAKTWLTSPNSFLDGASPVDVLLTDGPGDVIEAIDATVAGSYA